MRACCGESTLAHDVVMRFAEELAGRRHHITMNNYFTSIPLFVELTHLQIYATGMVQSNQVGLPVVLKNLCAFRRSPEGHLEWQMHVSRAIS